MNLKVLNTLQDIVKEEKLPINIEIGNSYQECDGNTSVDVLYEYDYKDVAIINEAICKAINLTFDLTDN